MYMVLTHVHYRMDNSIFSFLRATCDFGLIFSVLEKDLKLICSADDVWDQL
jgi:hypothetical protein